MRTLITRIADRFADFVPFEGLTGLAFKQQHLLGALHWRSRIKPFPSSRRIEDHWAAIVNIEQAAQAVSGDDDEPVVLLGATPVPKTGRYRRRRPEPDPPDESTRAVGIFPAINPLKPIVDRHDQPLPPDRPEERAVGDFLHPSVDRWGTIPGPMRPPAPAQIVGMNGLFVLMQNRQRSGGRCVVAIQWRIADVIDQRIGDAQHRNEIVNPRYCVSLPHMDEISLRKFESSRTSRCAGR